MPLRAGLSAKLTTTLIRRKLRKTTDGRFGEWTLCTRFPSPELVGAIQGLPFARVVYEPVDRYAAGAWFSPKERLRIARAEGQIVEHALVIATSFGVAKDFKHAAAGSYALPLGKDSRLKARHSSRTVDIPKPRLAVIGSLDWLADQDVLENVAKRRPHWHLVLVGPRAPRWGRRLQGLPNVHWLGTLNPEEARGVIAECDVALNPCVLNEWTKSAIPVKIFDYLAEGRPVVSTPMTELEVFGEAIEMAPAWHFVEAIERQLRADSSEAVARRRALSDRFTLQERARVAYELVTRVPEEAVTQRLA